MTSSDAPAAAPAPVRAPARYGAIALIALLAAAVLGLQRRIDARGIPGTVDPEVLYLRSPRAVTELSLSFRGLVADVYWMRALQHYGDTKLSHDPDKKYSLLYPLLDITTTLDPHFSLAYRLGAVLLAEPFPGGAGRTDLAIALLKKGIAAQPDAWGYPFDLGFIYYWWLHDYRTASEWFKLASTRPNAPPAISALAGYTAMRGGDRQTARYLWLQFYSIAPKFQDVAKTRLQQLDALDELDQLAHIVAEFRRRTGRLPASWAEVIRARLLVRPPVDPTGAPILLEPATGAVSLSPDSKLMPLPSDMTAAPAGPLR